MRRFVRITAKLRTVDGYKLDKKILELGPDREGYEEVTVEVCEQPDDGPSREVAKLTAG